MRFAYFLVGILALAGCARTTFSTLPSSQESLARPQAASPNGYHQLYSFEGMPDGAYPLKRLLDVNGALYGTANWGGQHNEGSGGEQTGTVFKWTASGSEKTVHVFQDYPDGRNPEAGLISVKGDLYGTTSYGGDDKNRGTVFKVDASGIESVVYRFAGPQDGKNPYGGLIYAKGLLYGTTTFGGAMENCDGGCGTVYSVSLTGSHTVLYRFKAGNDGASPGANLIYRNDKFYGIAGGGAPYYKGHGVVFEMTPSGHESVLYRFKGEPDGSGPGSGLTDVNGTFYGTTTAGGTKLGGTVYKIDSAGNESVVYNFPLKSTPESGLLYFKGALYGTTTYGGTAHHGTVFKVTLAGRGSIVYSFHGPTDGRSPTGGLINVNGILYGTTSQGGSSNDGTLFSVSP